MTMLQKLENTYLSILRFTVIVIAGLLIVCAVIFTARGIPALKDVPRSKIDAPQITADEMSALMTTDKQKKVSTSAAAASTSTAKSDSINEAHLDKIVGVISTFASDKSGGLIDLDAPRVKEIVRQAANDQDTPELVTAYLENLAAFAEKTFYSPQVQSLLGAKGANQAADVNTAAPVARDAIFNVINMLLTKYREKFSESVNNKRKENAAAALQHAEAKVNAQLSLYLALGSFVIFMLVVFMSIFIKIERNLRPQS
jgi:hypothetical protein